MKSTTAEGRVGLSDEDREIIAALARDPEFAQIARRLDLEDAARELGIPPG